MSLIITKEPKVICIKNAMDLSWGTWFTDCDNQVYVVVQDDKTSDRRVLCAGDLHHPFIANVPLKSFSVDRILQVGTKLQITNPYVAEGTT